MKLPNFWKIFLITAVSLLIVWGIFLRQQNGKSQDEVFLRQEKVTTQEKTLTEDEAIRKVSSLPQVQDFLKRVPGGQVRLDHEELQINSFIIQVFEVKDGHTATFNWYQVDKKTGEVKSEF